MARLVLVALALLFVAPVPRAQVSQAPADSAAASRDSLAADTVAVQPTGLGFAVALPDTVYADAPSVPALAGVVWTRPDTLAAALQDLQAMRLAGVRAVRTRLLEPDEEPLLALADTLGIQVYQDLPLANRPASALRRSLEEAQTMLRAAFALAERHPSARDFGLAVYGDASDPTSRQFFGPLAELVRNEAPEGSRSYYVSRFVEDDRAAQTVDYVLLDARDANPVDVLRRWQRRHETPAGIGAVGAGVVPGKEGGYLQAGSAAAQGRFLENALRRLYGLDTPPEAVFVYRWRDAGAELLDLALAQRAEATGLRYGLLDADGAPRPAFSVAEGFFTGRQTLFAFDAGQAEDEVGADTLVLLGWALLLALGLVYWLSPRLATTGQRYFVRHQNYREHLQRSRDLSLAAHVGLGGALAVAVGIAGTSALRGLARTDALATATAGWGETGQTIITRLLGQPILLVLLIALVYGTVLLFAMVWLYVLTGRKRRIRPAQALALVVWSRWSLLLLLIGAMLLTTLPPRIAASYAPLLILAWLIIEAVATTRMLYDFGHVTGVPVPRALGIGLAAPLALTIAAFIALSVTASGELTFLWHLATRT